MWSDVRLTYWQRVLRNRTWGPKCWTQGGGDRVRATGFIGTSEAGSQAGGGLVPGGRSGRKGLDDGRVVRQAGVWYWAGDRINKDSAMDG